jgi:serine/threonine-protein kinase
VVRGRYRILSKLGEGGMGAVYKAKHTGFDELRAIKVLNADLMGDEKLRQRFQREAFITRKLQHPNAVRVDDIDEAEDGRPFIVMEYIEGVSLRKVMEPGPMSAARVCAIAKQVAAALEAAHGLGMVHRDIKPDNIVLVRTPEGEQAKVLDFGIAKIKEGGLREEAKGMDLTGVGYVVGTPRYVSPEQAKGKRGDDLDGRSDLYSLAVVMYEMLTGNVPFQAETTMEVLIAHIQKSPNPVQMVRTDLRIPEALASLVMRTLQKKRELRPPTATAFIEELTRVEEGLPPGASGIPPRLAGSAPRGQPGAPPVPAPAAQPPAARYAASDALPAAAAPGESAGLSPARRNGLIAILVLGLGGGIWYHSTHRPADLIARHRDAAADFESQRLWAQAEEEYRAAAKLDANDATLFSALGNVLIQEKKWDEGMAALREAVTLRPDDAVTHNNLGVALQTVGKVPDAITEYREALRLKPDYIEAHHNLGDALEKQNDLAGSIAEYREVLRSNPDDAEAHFHLGLALYKQGNSDAAVEEYREAIRLKPGFALAHFSLGGVLYNQGEHEAGIEELRTAYSLSPDDPEIRASYQKLLEK